MLSPGVPALEEFPWATWRKAGELLDRSGATDRLDRVELLGATHLPHSAIAEYLAFSRGVLCDPEHIVVTAGAHNAIDLIARVVFDPGDEVWFEDPGYVAARATLVMNGAKVRPIPVDEEGLRVEDGLRLSPQAQAAFVTPSHHYPLGVEMTKARDGYSFWTGQKLIRPGLWKMISVAIFDMQAVPLQHYIALAAKMAIGSFMSAPFPTYSHQVSG